MKFTKIKKFILTAISVNLSIILIFVFIIVFTQTAQASWLSNVWYSFINSISGNNQTQTQQSTQSANQTNSIPATSQITTGISLPAPTTNTYQSPLTAGVSVGNCPVSVPGCNTPINVSNNTQFKIGALGIGGVLYGYSDAVFDGSITTAKGVIFPDGTMQSNASYAFGGIYVIEGTSSCRRVNPLTGGCSCPSGFLGSFASDGPMYSIFCYKAGSISTNAPVVTLSASPTTIGTGQATTLSWTSSDAASCTAGGNWNGSKATNGSEAVTSSNDSDASTIHTYNLDCSNAVGTTSKNVSVNIKGWQNTTGEGNLNESCNAWLSRTGQSGVNGATASAINTNGSRSTGGVGMCWYRVGALNWDNFLGLSVGGYTIQMGTGGDGFLDGGYSATAVSRNLNCSTCYTQTRR